MERSDGTRGPGLLDRIVGLSWRFLLVAAALVVLGIVLARLELIVVPLVVAILIAVVVTPGARLSERMGLGHTLGAALIYVAALGTVAALIVVFTPQFLSQFSTLRAALADSGASLRNWLIHGPLSLSPPRVDSLYSQVARSLTGGTGRLSSGLLSGATTFAKLIAGGIVAVILSFFFVKDGSGIWTWLLRMLPQERREDVDAIGLRAWHVLGRYLLGSALNGGIESGIMGLTLLVLGVPLVVPLMLLQFAGAFFPLVGAIVAGGIAVAVTLAATDLTHALIVLAVVIAVHQLEGNVLAPLVLGGEVRLHPVVILVVLTAGALIAGVVGAFVAVPVTAVAWGVLKELVRREVIEPPGDVEALSDEPPGEEGLDDRQRPAA